MRTITLAFLAIAVSLSSAADPPRPAPTADKPLAWQDDPVCRMVFFAVLEGLYEDGVPVEAVEGVLRRPKVGDSPVKGSFVAQCPLCHPVFEAFALYQKRLPFAGDSEKRDTFGKGIDPMIVTALRSDNTQTRLVALRGLVKQWVERRLTAMRLTETEKKEWEVKLGKRSQQGKTFLDALMRTDPNYKGWSIYWGCAACNGTRDACHAVGKK